MTFNNCLLCVILFILLSCSEKNNYKKSDSSIEKLKYFLKQASDVSVSYNSRVYYNNRAFDLLNNVTNDSIFFNHFNSLNANYKDLNLNKDLKKASEVFLKKSIEFGFKDQTFHAYRWNGIYYETIRILDSAYLCYLKAGKIAQHQDDIAQNNLDKANVLSSVSNYNQSDYLAIKALKFFKDEKNFLGQWDALNLLAINSQGAHEYLKAIEYNEKALQISIIHNLKLNEISLNNIGNNYAVSGNHHKAITYFRTALKTKNLYVSNTGLYATLLDNLAFSRLRINDKKDISSLFFKALKIRDSLDRKSKVAYSYVHISEYLFSIKNLEKSKLYGKKALSLAKETKLPEDLLNSLCQLSKVDAENALQYSTQYIRISDSIQQLERINRNKFAKIAYETEELIQEKDYAIYQRRLYFWIFVTIMTLGLLLLVINFQRVRQKDLQLKQIQQNANEKIYYLMLDQQNKIDQGRALEKKRIAQELHDGIMNKLASTRLNLQVLYKKPSPESQAKSVEFIDDIQKIEREIRNIAHDLNNETFFGKASFITIIESFVNEQNTLSNINCHLEIDRDIEWREVSGYKKIHLFRILQEAFHNINKHAEASNVIVSILNRETELLLEIYDDGVGFITKKKSKGIGIQNMLSRTHDCKGIFTIKSKKGKGTTIIVVIPLDVIS